MNLTKEDIDKAKAKLDLLPVDNQVVILQDQYKPSSNIILSDQSRRGGSLELYEGVILALGESVPEMYQEGDVVMFGKFAFSSITRPPLGKPDERQEFLFVRYHDIFCFVDQDNKREFVEKIVADQKQANAEKRELIKNINKESEDDGN